MKKFLICLGLLCNFLFINRIYAADSFSIISESNYNIDNLNFTYNNITYNKEILYDKINSYINNNTDYSLSDFKYIFIGIPSQPTTASNDIRNKIYIDLFGADFEPTSFTAPRNLKNSFEANSTSETRLNIYINFSNGSVSAYNPIWAPYTIYSMYDGSLLNGFDDVYTNFPFDLSSIINNSEYSDFIRFHIGDMGYNFISDNINFGPKTYTINFHLNGGNVMDMSNLLNPILREQNYSISTDDYELNDYLSSITPMKSNSDFVGWYYDSNFTQQYDSSNTVSSDIDLYAKWDERKWTFNFHLNGGHITNRNTNESNYSNFSITLYKDEIENYLSNNLFSHNNKGFEGLYFDSNYLYKLNGNEDTEYLNSFSNTYNGEKYIDVYVKFYYLTSQDFINDNNMTKYIFDKNYDYAIISRGSGTGTMYIGLDFLTNNLPIYLYDATKNEILFTDTDGQSDHCFLQNRYTFGNRYFYEIANYCFNNRDKNTYDVLILPKAYFERIGIIGDYEFYLTNNVHVTYTNNLVNMTIYDESNEPINTNINNMVGYSEEFLYNDDTDLTKRFKDLINLKDNRLFENIQNIWDKFKATPLYNYFMILIIGSLIIAIIRAAKRN